MKRSVIEIVSNVRCRIHNLDDSRAESLDHALSFTIKGSFFTGRVKRFGWDGKTHLFNIHGHSFPKGLLGKVIRLFEDNGWKYRLEDSRRNVLPPPKLSRLHPDMLHGVSLSGAYSFQLDAARKALKAGSGILWLATNAGKSTVAAAMIATDPKVQTLVVVPKVNLAYQFRDELAERFGTVKQNIGLIGAGHFDVRPITVAVVNSLQRKRGKRSAKRNAALSDLFKQVRRVFFDECFEGKTMVTLADGRRRTIKSIVKSNQEIRVLSYNTKTGKIEPKRVVRKIKKHRFLGNSMLRVTVNLHGRYRTVLCTPNHKFWSETAKDYIRADHLKTGNNVVVASRDVHASDVCPPPKFDRLSGEGLGKVGQHNAKFRGGIHKCGSKTRQYYYVTLSVLDLVLPHLADLAGISLIKARKRAARLVIETKTGRIRRSNVVWMLAHGRRLKRWEDIHHEDDNPLNDRIANLKLMTHGSHSSHSGNQYHGRLASIPIPKIGKVVKIEEGDPSGLVYNLEVEDNHNYFANDVLVSNCHHLKAKMWKKVSRALVNAQFRYGLSGSAMTGEGDDLQVLAEVGPIVARVKNKKLIKLGVSAKPTVEMVTIDEPQIDSGSWDEVYKQGIVMNAQRNRHITLAVRQDVDDGMPSLVLVREIWHGELLSQMFKLNKIPHKFIHGELPPSAQREAIHAFDDEMLPAMIATTGLLDEGISIKAIRRITFADGYKSLRLTLQKLGRALRAKRSGENVVLIRDFADATHKWLASHALERYEIFESEGFKIITVDPNEEPKKVTKQNMVVHCKKDKYDVYIGRPSKWGNPFSHKQGTIAKFKVKSLEEAISSYEIWIKSQPNLMKDLHELRGKVLGCWCKPGSCHGDVLARLANSKTDPITALAKSWGLGK